MMVAKLNNLKSNIKQSEEVPINRYQQTGSRMDALTFGNGIGTSPTSITRIER